MADKPLNLTAALSGDQTRVTLGEGHKGKNQIVIVLTNPADEPVAFEGFGKRGEFTVTVSVGSGAPDLVRTLDESLDLKIDAPHGWQARPYKKVANQAVYVFRLPHTVFEPRERKTITLKNFVCCTDPGRARLQIDFAISDFTAFEATLEVEKKALVFELLFFEADPPYIATSAEKGTFTLSWSTVQAGRVELYKNQRKLATFTAGLDDYENGRKYTYRGEHPDLTGTTYELTAYDQADASQSRTIQQTVHVLQAGWHAVAFPQYGYPAMLCSLDDVNLYGIFIKNGEACLCSSKHPFAIWDLENGTVPDDMATSPGVSFNNRIWLVGGSSVDSDNFSNRVYSYDIEQGRWQDHPTNWPARMGHACVAFKRRLWVMGGMDADGNALQDLHRMDARDNWQHHGEAPWDPRCMLAAASYNKKLWIYGGCAEPFGDPRTDMWTSADGKSWESYEILPRPDNGALGQPISNSLQVVNGKLHLLGSFRSGHTVQARMCILNEAQQSWFVSDVTQPWDQQEQNTHSLSGATFNDLVYLRSLDYRIDDNPTRLYLYKP
jgi:hypothetical protein